MIRIVVVLSLAFALLGSGSAFADVEAGADVASSAADCVSAVADNPYADAESCGGDAYTGCGAGGHPLASASSRTVLITLLAGLFVGLRAATRREDEDSGR